MDCDLAQAGDFVATRVLEPQLQSRLGKELANSLAPLYRNDPRTLHFIFCIKTDRSQN